MAASSAAREPDIILHANCAAIANKAVLIRGPSGCGKSGLTLELLALGAGLVSDDQTCLIRSSMGVIAYAPNSLLGAIEARGVGILRADIAPPTPVALVIDLDQIETDRLPHARTCDLLGHRFPLLRKANGSHFPAAVLNYLRAGPWTPN